MCTCVCVRACVPVFTACSRLNEIISASLLFLHKQTNRHKNYCVSVGDVYCYCWAGLGIYRCIDIVLGAVVVTFIVIAGLVSVSIDV